MRLIATLNDPQKAYALSAFLTQKDIDNMVEVKKDNDWGSSDYGTTICTIWIYEEDQLEDALSIVSEFHENPDDPRYYHLATDAQTSAEEKPLLRAQGKKTNGTNAKATLAPQPIGPLTLYLLFACILLYIFMAVTSPSIKAIPHYLSYTPVLASPIQKEMMYDYPLKYELVDQLVKTYGLEALKDPEKLPGQGQQLLEKYLQTPMWTGIYEKIVNHFQHPESAWKFDAPMFEKIRQGELWRLFTPCLLHAGIFHLFFNMAWLVILGKQMEQRMGKMRYILFIIIAGIIPNTAQYLMSGPDFLGFSGVLCAMLAYIWVRQKRAAWEGYQLQAGTLSFITFFILLMLGIQLVSFIFELRNSSAFAIGIANTAHLVGAAVGYLLGRMPFFSWQAKLTSR
jgi:GlpG protein